MEITINKMVEEKKQITIPYYAKTICHAYMVYDEQSCIQITFGIAVHNAISTAHSGLPFSSEYEEIERDEFIAIWDEVSSVLFSKTQP